MNAFNFLSFLHNLKSLTIHKAGIAELEDVTDHLSSQIPDSDLVLDIGYNDIDDVDPAAMLPDSIKEIRFYAPLDQVVVQLQCRKRRPVAFRGQSIGLTEHDVVPGRADSPSVVEVGVD